MPVVKGTRGAPSKWFLGHSWARSYPACPVRPFGGSRPGCRRAMAGTAAADSFGSPSLRPDRGRCGQHAPPRPARPARRRAGPCLPADRSTGLIFRSRAPDLSRQEHAARITATRLLPPRQCRRAANGGRPRAFPPATAGGGQRGASGSAPCAPRRVPSTPCRTPHESIRMSYPEMDRGVVSDSWRV